MLTNWTAHFRGSKKLGAGDFEAAALHFAHAAAADPGDSFARLMVGYCYEALGRYQEALGVAERSLEINAADFFALQLAGNMAARLGEHARGRAVVREALGLFPEPTEVPKWLHAGMRMAICLPVVRGHLREDAAAQLEGSDLALKEQLELWRSWADSYLAWCEKWEQHSAAQQEEVRKKSPSG
jgi:tetratricopeptide (TPR) repeat protein